MIKDCFTLSKAFENARRCEEIANSVLNESQKKDYNDAARSFYEADQSYKNKDDLEKRHCTKAFIYILTATTTAKILKKRKMNPAHAPTSLDEVFPK